MDKNYKMEISFKSNITETGIERLKEWMQAFLTACPIPMEIKECTVTNQEGSMNITSSSLSKDAELEDSLELRTSKICTSKLLDPWNINHYISDAQSMINADPKTQMYLMTLLELKWLDRYVNFPQLSDCIFIRDDIQTYLEIHKRFCAAIDYCVSKNERIISIEKEDATEKSQRFFGCERLTELAPVLKQVFYKMHGDSPTTDIATLKNMIYAWSSLDMGGVGRLNFCTFIKANRGK